MKKIFSVLVLTLAANFLAAAAGVYWLYSGGRLDKQKVAEIKKILFPPPPPEAPQTQPVDPTTQPTLRLEELLAKHAGRPAAEQLEFIRKSFDSQMAQLDRASRELWALKQQVQAAQEQLSREKAALAADRLKLTERERQAEKLASDKGFQDSLERYEALPAKQVKTVFMGLDDATAISYLQAMDAGKAAKIMKEFKSPEETQRLKTLMEKMRQPQAAAKE